MRRENSRGKKFPGEIPYTRKQGETGVNRVYGDSLGKRISLSGLRFNPFYITYIYTCVCKKGKKGRDVQKRWIFHSVKYFLHIEGYTPRFPTGLYLAIRDIPTDDGMRPRRPKKLIGKLTPEIVAGIDRNLEAIQVYLSRLSRELSSAYRPSSLAAKMVGKSAESIEDLRTQIQNRLEKDRRMTR
jgi:hypothetical protein